MPTHIDNISPLIKANYIQKPQSQEAYEKRLRKACSEFESLFIYYMLKAMRNSIAKCEWLHQDRTEDIHMSLFDQEMSLYLSKSGGIGIGDMLYQQLDPETHFVKHPSTYINALKLKGAQTDTIK